MTNLSVNVNKIAWLRNARGEDRPNLIETSKILIEAGIQGLTVHPRPDLRHITPDDVYDLSLLCKDHDIEFNIEGNPYSEETTLYPGFVQLVKAIEPDQCTLVPDAIDQLTSDHGWDLHLKDHNSIKNIPSSENKFLKNKFVLLIFDTFLFTRAKDLKILKSIFLEKIKKSFIVHICILGVLYQSFGSVFVTGIVPLNNKLSLTFQ
mgnify:CR=1 FL=1